MLSQRKKALTVLSAGALLFGQVLVGAEETTSSSPSSSAPAVETVASSAMSPSSSEPSSSSAVEVVPSSPSSQELPVSSSVEAPAGSSSQVSPPVTETELTVSSSSQATSQPSSSSSLSAPAKQELKVDLTQLAKKDYSSLVGTWKSGDGTTLFITTEGVIYTKGANGGYMSLDGLATDQSQALVLKLKNHPEPGSAGLLYLAPAGQSFVTSGQTAVKDKTDQTKDRFILGEPYANGREKAVFYRVSSKLDGLNPLSEEVAETSAVSSSAGNSSQQTETELSLPPAAREKTPTKEEATDPAQSGSASSSRPSSDEGSSRTDRFKETSSSSSPDPNASGSASRPTQSVSSAETKEADGKQDNGPVGPQTRTVVRRILPRTGEQTSPLLPVLGLLSLLTFALLRKKRQ